MIRPEGLQVDGVGELVNVGDREEQGDPGLFGPTGQ